MTDILIEFNLKDDCKYTIKSTYDNLSKSNYFTNLFEISRDTEYTINVSESNIKPEHIDKMFKLVSYDGSSEDLYKPINKIRRKDKIYQSERVEFTNFRLNIPYISASDFYPITVLNDVLEFKHIESLMKEWVKDFFECVGSDASRYPDQYNISILSYEHIHYNKPKSRYTMDHYGEFMYKVDRDNTCVYGKLRLPYGKIRHARDMDMIDIIVDVSLVAKKYDAIRYCSNDVYHPELINIYDYTYCDIDRIINLSEKLKFIKIEDFNEIFHKCKDGIFDNFPWDTAYVSNGIERILHGYECNVLTVYIKNNILSTLSSIYAVCTHFSKKTRCVFKYYGLYIIKIIMDDINLVLYIDFSYHDNYLCYDGKTIYGHEKRILEMPYYIGGLIDSDYNCLPEMWDFSGKMDEYDDIGKLMSRVAREKHTHHIKQDSITLNDLLWMQTPEDRIIFIERMIMDSQSKKIIFNMKDGGLTAKGKVIVTFFIDSVKHHNRTQVIRFLHCGIGMKITFATYNPLLNEITYTTNIFDNGTTTGYDAYDCEISIRIRQVDDGAYIIEIR